MKKITIVLGTAREGRESEKVARVVTEAFNRAGAAEVTFVDVRDHLDIPRTLRRIDTDTNAFKEWQEIATRSDAFIFVLPEYHRGYPGEWKLFVDSLETEYRNKLGYIVGVSNGMFAGVRMGEHVKPVLVELGLMLHRTALYVGNVETAFDTEGKLIDDGAQKRLDKFVEDVVAQVHA